MSEISDVIRRQKLPRYREMEAELNGLIARKAEVAATLSAAAAKTIPGIPNGELWDLEREFRDLEADITRRTVELLNYRKEFLAGVDL